MNDMSVPQIIPSAPSGITAAKVAFTGRRRAFFGLLVRGTVLELITVGFYRFWLITDLRRHLWSHTVVERDALEYTGRGRELLVGFLIATAILSPVYAAYFLAGIEAERMHPFASIPLLAVLYVFGQFAIYRARRYRLTRTVWRGVRFWMGGSGWAYAMRASAWSLLVILTLGFALPWRDAALERYKMRHSFYGELPGGFQGTGGDFFRQAWWLWPLAFVSIILFPLAPFVYGAFKSIQWRWWVNGVRFGEVRFETDLGGGALISLYWKVIGWTLLVVALAVAALLVAAAVAGAMNGLVLSEDYRPRTLQQNFPFIAGSIIAYLIAILAFNVAKRLYLMRDLWAMVVGSVRIDGLAAADNVAARGTPSNALGEGFADGLDVGGF